MNPCVGMGDQSKEVRMRHVVRLFSYVAVGALVLTATAVPVSADDLDTNRFQVTERTGTQRFEDVGKPGASVGDSVTYMQRLFHHGNRVGREDGRCDVTQSIKSTVTNHCMFTLTFGARGQIAVQGTFVLDFKRSSAVNVLAITGGTGAYNGAAGSIRVMTAKGEPNRVQVRLQD